MTAINGIINDEDMMSAIFRAAELAVIIDFPLPELVKVFVGAYETSVNDVKSGHSAAYGWQWLTDEEREVAEQMDIPITEKCEACSESHHNDASVSMGKQDRSEHMENAAFVLVDKALDEDIRTPVFEVIELLTEC